MKYICITLLIFTTGYQTVFAQPSINNIKVKLKPDQVKDIQLTVITPVQAGILFSHNEISRSNIKQWLAAQLEMRPGIDVLNDAGIPTKAAANTEVIKLQQYYRSIKVEHGNIKVTSRNDFVKMLQLEFYTVPGDLNIVPAIPEPAALQKAAGYMGVADITTPRPAGELVIVRSYDDDSSICLAWKFTIHKTNPLADADVYVNAATGKIVLRDDNIKHANGTNTATHSGGYENAPVEKVALRYNNSMLADTSGTATTRYNGTQAIITDNGSGDPAKPYRLRQTRNLHKITTLNYNNLTESPANTLAAVDFTDNDNNWEASEHDNTTQDNMALDVHFNMQIISDYWKLVHSRNGWDNNNQPLLSYVHVAKNCGTVAAKMDNAFWFKGAMYYGDGSFGTTGNPCAKNYRPLVALDITAHEVGHGITESTSNLVNRWESGALNEGFSDIWAALIEQWGVEQYPSIAMGKSTWRIAEEVTSTIGLGFRNLDNPRVRGYPNAYKGTYWLQQRIYPYCLPEEGNDLCGVHINSSVLAKWFHLITMGEIGSNTFNQPYDVAGMGFTKSTNLAYLSTLNLTPNATYATAKAVTMNAAVTIFGTGSAEVETVRAAWRAVGVDSAIWDISNTPAFADNNAQSFTSIGIGKDYKIWAGTDKRGLYVYDPATAAWSKRSEVPNVRINDIKADKKGGIWIAQSGTTNSGTAAGGGVNYFADPAAAMTGFYTLSTQINVPTRNVRTIFIDKTRMNEDTNSRVWIATNTYFNASGASASGKPAVGFNSTNPNFSPINAGIELSNGTGGVTSIGGNKDVIWTFAADNYNKNQIISYNAGTAAFIAAYDNSTVPTIPVNINVRAIHTDRYNRTWFTLATNAVLVHDQNNAWHYINFPAAFQAGSQANNNAIAESKKGDIYIGTSAGLVFFEAGYTGEVATIDLPASYKLFKKHNGLPSDNITGIAYDSARFKLWVASDQGICMWDPLCLGLNCHAFYGYLTQAGTVSSGNWSDTSIWDTKQIPDSNTEVLIRDSVVVDINASCRSLQVLPGGSTRINTGRNLTIYQKDEVPIEGDVRRRERRQK